MKHNTRLKQLLLQLRLVSKKASKPAPLLPPPPLDLAEADRIRKEAERKRRLEQEHEADVRKWQEFYARREARKNGTLRLRANAS